MKFSQISAFEKHLKNADPAHLSDVYLVVDQEVYVQRKLAQKVVQQEENEESYQSEGLTLGQLRQALETRSLFDPKKCCILYSIEKLSKPCLEMLLKNVQNPHPHIRLVLTASQMTPACQKMIKTIIALDLSSEKPWDRERRLADYVIHTLKVEGLFISTALAEQVVKRAGSKVAQIDQELEKLICFLDGKKEVRREDLALMQQNFQYSIFKIGEALLDRKTSEALQIIHETTFPTILLLYSLRNLFQRSLRLKELSREEMLKCFPTLKGKFLEKNLNLIKKHSKQQLQKILILLFESEVMMKNQKMPEHLMQSLILFKIGAVSESLSV